MLWYTSHFGLTECGVIFTVQKVLGFKYTPSCSHPHMRARTHTSHFVQGEKCLSNFSYCSDHLSPLPSLQVSSWTSAISYKGRSCHFCTQLSYLLGPYNLWVWVLTLPCILTLLNRCMQHMHIIAYKKQLKIIAINTSRLLNPHQGDWCFHLSKHQCFGVDSDRYIGDRRYAYMA